MLKVGLIGIGFMGRGHLDNYIRLEKEGKPIKLVAICDIDEDKFKNITIKGNLDIGKSDYDFSKYALYTSIDEMLEKEELDYVDIALPTYMHAEAAIKALDKGMHALSEKPMALNVKECDAMAAAAERSGKKLMVAQCLRFWPAYEKAKELIDNKKYGETQCAYFFRGGSTPIWSYENWLLKDEKSGGALLDQHIHDVDTINWFFGMPKAVSTSAKNIIPGSGYDAVSTNYFYPDGKVVNAQDDWTINGKGFGFEMIFRVNFERGSIVLLNNGECYIYENDGEKIKPELDKDNGYYREIVYFAHAIVNDTPIETATPKSTRDTIFIAEAEVRSAKNGGMPEAL